MKKVNYFLVVMAMCSSCTNDLSDIDIKEKDQVQVKTRAGADGVYDNLGFGYDVTGYYLDPSSVRLPILDMNKVVADPLSDVVIHNNSYGDIQFRYSFDSYDYTKTIAKKAGVTASGLDSTDGVFSGNLNFTSDNYQKYALSTKYSFASLSCIKHHRQLIINYRLSEGLYKFLSDKFIFDINNLSPDNLVKLYGTHVLTKFNIGGRYDILYQTHIVNHESDFKKTESIKSGFNAQIRKIGFSFGTDNSVTINNTYVSQNREKTFHVKYYGGASSGIKTFNLEDGTISPIDIQKWEDSLNPTNSCLTEIDWSVTVPLYELIEDPIKRANVKIAVEKYIKSKSIQPLDLYPLYEGYHAGTRDHFYTLNKDELEKYNYINYGPVGYVTKTQNADKACIPVYQGWHKKSRDHYYTTDRSNFSRFGYADQGVAYYIYPTEDIGRVDLFEGYHKKIKDHYYTTIKSNIAAHNYTYLGILGRIYSY